MKLPASLRHFISTVLGGLAKLQVLWKEWDLRGFIIASFALQVVLILIGPFRKQTSNGVVVLSIWLSYLLADWVAVQAVGFIPKTSSNDAEGALFAFWAQFLLLHLGGPDTITALALEDNELWLRTGLQLGVQVYATFGVLVRSIQQSNLWVPTILMFFAGVIKYLERVLSLLHGRLSDSDEEPDYDAKLLEACEPRWYDWSHSTTDLSEEKPTNIEMVRHGFYFFHYYKGLYAGQFLSNDDVRKSRDYFLLRTKAEAFRLLEIELNFAYEAFYTKTVIIHKKVGKVLRPIAMLFEVACLVIWCFIRKRGFHHYDIRITYTLLIGAIAVDVLAFFRIQLSDWNIPHLKKDCKIRSWFYNKLLSARNRTWGRYRSKDEAPFSTWLRRAFSRRWSESVSQFNLIDFCVDERSPKMQKAIEYFCLKDVLDRRRYVTNKWFFDDLRDTIFDGLRPGELVMSRLAALRIFSRQDWSDWFKTYVTSKGLEPEVYGRFFDFKLEDTLIGWHILTEVCYRSEIKVAGVEDKKENLWKRILGCMKTVSKCQGKAADKEAGRNEEKDVDEELADRDEVDPNIYRELSKVVSDYMLYLLVWKPAALPVSASTSKKTFRDTCASVKEILKSTPELILNYSNESGDTGFDLFEGSRHLQSALSHALGLEEMLQPTLKMKTTEMWKFMSGLWILVLCYTAKHCQPNFYAARLKEGGELLSFVWLLMAHFGLGQLIVH